MFSNALKSFSSNITSNYTISAQSVSASGPWKIFDAKRKQTGKAASVFVFDRKALEPPGGGLGGRNSAASLKRVHDEILERLKKEASSLARLRHPSILELAEPVEETRNGGLMFATEPVTASLAGLLQEKDEQERAGGVGGRGSRYVVEEADGTRKRRELEIDELEIQKGLLQIGKGLEFLHESAGLVHANLTPEAVLVNVKGDWKISGLAFCGPHESSTAATSLTPIQLSEVLNHDPRLPRSVQLNLDYASPDFVVDNTLAASADMFSLGLLMVALYNSPHTSSLSTGGSLSTAKRAFSTASSMPTQGNNYLIPSSRPLPPKLASDLLPRLLARRPAQRLSAKEFQQASYFDNILVSTVRFLDELPAKTPGEKAQFLRGLPKLMPQFPKSVLEKKVLPILLEETKDKELLALIISNAFAMVKILPAGKRAFSDQIVPKLKEVFTSTGRSDKDTKDTSKEAGLMIVLENMETAASNCDGKSFHDDLLPIILIALESPTHAVIDAALGTLPLVLPVLDFSTIKNELFPVIAAVFAKTSSLNIKIRGLDAFYTLCGGSAADIGDADDDLNGIGIVDKKPGSSSSAILDKFTVQEKVVPLLKGIKTKEPGVMIAALRVFKQVGVVADSDYLAMEVLPILWSMSLGPLLNLQQFQAFMSLIKNLGERIEREQTRKLRELGAAEHNSAGVGLGSRSSARTGRGSGLGGMNGLTNGDDADFESLVSGRKANATNNDNDLMNDWGAPRPANPHAQISSQFSNDTTTFSWQTPASASTTLQPQSMNGLRSHVGRSGSRAITPDLSAFTALTPASSFSQPLQPSRPSSSGMAATTMPMRPAQQNTSSGLGTGLNWSTAASNSATNAWASQRPTQRQTPSSDGFGAASRPSQGSLGSFTLSPPPSSTQNVGQFNASAQHFGGSAQQSSNAGANNTGQKTGMEKYESLL